MFPLFVNVFRDSLVDFRLLPNLFHHVVDVEYEAEFALTVTFLNVLLRRYLDFVPENVAQHAVHSLTEILL